MKHVDVSDTSAGAEEGGPVSSTVGMDKSATVGLIMPITLALPVPVCVSITSLALLIRGALLTEGARYGADSRGPSWRAYRRHSRRMPRSATDTACSAHTLGARLSHGGDRRGPLLSARAM